MVSTNATRSTTFGQQLKRWRALRGLSQLALAVEAQTSPRHVSFIETGRSKPSRAMVTRLADVLEVPLRERNDLLLAAGLAPGYPERALSEDMMAPFASIVRQMLQRHEPYPAMVIDRWWRVLTPNRAAVKLLPLPADGESLVEMFFGEPYRALIENWDDVVWAGYRSLKREALQSPHDRELQRLLRCAEERLPEAPAHDAGQAVVVAPRVRIGDQILETVSTVVRFSSAREITLDELRIELVFPANEAAERYFLEMAD